MAKYRGKYNGKTRGKYTERRFRCSVNGSEESFKLFSKISDFLNDKGRHVYYGEKLRDILLEGDPTGDYIFECTNVFHFAGATAKLCKSNFHDSFEDDKVRHYNVSLNFMSNDSLDDIIDKMTNELPAFKKMAESCD